VLGAAMTAAAVAAVVSRSEAVTSYPRPPTQGRTCGVTVMPNAACRSLRVPGPFAGGDDGGGGGASSK